MTTLSTTYVDNAGNETNVALQPVPERVTIDVPANLDATELAVTFALSEGAKATMAGQHIASPVTLSTEQSSVIRVVAANGHSERFYTIEFVKPNTIDWTLAQSRMFYGESLVDLPATSSAGLPIEYTSDSPNVLTVTGQGFRAVGVGTATITAHQPGAANYAPARSVAYRVEVLPRVATIAPRAMVIEHGAMPGALDLYYSGLLPQDDLLRAKLPDYHILNGSTPWDASQGPLAVGQYDIAPKDDTPYSVMGYRITPLKGTLTVKSSQAVQLSLSVVDQSNAALEGATITLDSTIVVVSGTTPYLVDVLPGVHHYVVEKEGYAPEVGSVMIVDAPVVETVTLRVRDLTLTYTKVGEGRLEGPISQKVAKGEDGQPVFAIPADGYIFAGWSDSYPSENRVDRNVQGSQTLTATFKQATYTLTYNASLGGTITGSATQTVPYKGDGTEVTAKPDADNYFIQWNDRNRKTNRTEKYTTVNKEFTAFFGRVVSLPYMQHFETTNPLPAFMYYEEGRPVGSSWYVTKEPVRGYSLDGYALAIDFPNVNGSINPNVYTPRFALKDVSGNITIEFDYIFGAVMSTNISVSYMLSDGSRGKIGTLTRDANRRRTHFKATVENDKFAGKEWIQFSFNYSGPTHEIVLIDNLAIAPEGVTGDVQLNYYATKGGKVNGKTRVNSTTPAGTEGLAVTATEETGYRFAGWSDGVTAAQRKDSKATTVEALFVPTSAGPASYSLTYTAGEHGRIAGVPIQKGIKAGASGLPVEAIATTPSYAFMKWSDGRTDNPRTDVNLAGDVNVKALFANVYTLTYEADPADGGQITGGATQTIEYGKDAKPVTATANAPYHFVRWSDGFAEATRTDMNVRASATIKAYFAKQYTFVYSATKGGMIEGTAQQVLDKNVTGTSVTAKPYAGYVFHSWSDGVTEAARADKAEMELDVVATFKPKTFVLTYSAGAGGTLQGATDPQTIAYGEDSKPVLAQPDAGYVFVKWDDGRTDNPRYETAVVAEVVAQAIFSQNITLTYSATTGGAIEGTATQTVPYGGDGQPVEAKPEAPYRFIGWSDGITDNPRTDTKNVRDLSVVALFSNTYTMAYSASRGGTIDGIAVQTVAHEGNATPVTAKAFPGYEFVHWSDDSDQPTRNDATIVADATYTAIFAPKKHTLTIKVPNGEFSIPGFPDFTFAFAKPVQPTYEVEHEGVSEPIGLELAPGVTFEKWDDGSTEYPRMFVATEDKTISATVKVPSVELLVERDNVPKETVLVFDQSGHGFAPKQTVALGALVGINIATGRIPIGSELEMRFEGLRYCCDKWGSKFYQVIDASKPARVILSIGRPSFQVLYHASAGGMLVGDTIQKVVVGSSSKQVSAVAMPGYYFAGWSDGNTNAERFDIVIDANIEVTALFEPIVYSIAYYANGGAGSMPEQQVRYGRKVALTANAFTHPYATFKGWATQPNATEPLYADAQRVRNLADNNGDVVKLYALWDAPQYAVHFEVAGAPEGHGTLVATVDGQPIVSGATLPAGTEVHFVAAPETGYVISGWDGVTPQAPNSTEVTSILTEETTVTVTFTRAQLKVNFGVAGAPDGHGTLVATVDGQPIESGATLPAGTEVHFVANPDAHYMVSGWSGVAPQASNSTEATLTLTEETTVTVAFSLIRHKVYYLVAGEPNGTLTATVDGKPFASGELVDEGDTVLFAAEPKPGFVVERWTGLTPPAAGDVKVPLTVLQEAVVTITFKAQAQPPVNPPTPVESVLLAQVEAVPNPFTSYLHVTGATHIVRVTLLSLTGQPLMAVTHDGSERLELPVTTLPAGLYLLRCEDGQGGVRTLRIVKQ